MSELRELNALSAEVAERVIGESMPAIVDCSFIIGTPRFSPLNAWMHVHRYENGDKCEWEPRPYATSIYYAFQVEDRIAELGLQARYVINLAKLVDPRVKQDDAIMSLWWNLVHASPEQRCRAALECVKEKGRATNA